MAENRKLNDGNFMPNLGLGFWKLKSDEIDTVMSNAIESGYRLFDTAAVYGNEEDLGRALHKSGLKREEYFVVTKLSPKLQELQGYEGAKESLKSSLEKLGLDYVDLYLVHTPNPGKNIESWKACCELKKDGLTKSIGVSNYNVQHLKGIIDAGFEIPAVNQIEFHPWYQENECLEFCTERNITMMAYCPIARAEMFEGELCPLVNTLAKKYNKTKAQIVLRWGLQRNVIPVPKSSNKERILENIQVYDFELTTEDMKAMDGLNEGYHCCSASHVMQKSWEELETQHNT